MDQLEGVEIPTPLGALCACSSLLSLFSRIFPTGGVHDSPGVPLPALRHIKALQDWKFSSLRFQVAPRFPLVLILETPGPPLHIASLYSQGVPVHGWLLPFLIQIESEKDLVHGGWEWYLLLYSLVGKARNKAKRGHVSFIFKILDSVASSSSSTSQSSPGESSTGELLPPFCPCPPELSPTWCFFAHPPSEKAYTW